MNGELEVVSLHAAIAGRIAAWQPISADAVSNTEWPWNGWSSEAAGAVNTSLVATLTTAALLLYPPSRGVMQDAVSVERRLRQTFDRLQAIEIQDNDPVVPTDAVSLLAVFKHQLRDLFSTVLEQAKDAGAPELTRRFKKAIGRAGLSVEDLLGSRREFTPDDPGLRRVLDHPYGFVWDVDVQIRHDVLVAAITLSIECGSDTSLYAFEREAGGWRRTADVESTGYAEIFGARGSSDWAIVSGPGSGEWSLIATDVNPSCASNWQQLRWVVLRPGEQPDRPRVIGTGNATIYLGNELRDKSYRLTADRRGFRLVWWGGQDLDAGMLIRPHVATFTIAGGVRREPPFAFRADDFVDEWVHAPWEDAAKVTAAAAQDSARPWHALLADDRSERPYVTSLEFVQRCPQPGTWQAGLTFEPTGETRQLPSGVPAELFFVIARHASRLEMVDVETTAFAGCRGRTPPQPQPRKLPR